MEVTCILISKIFNVLILRFYRPIFCFYTTDTCIVMFVTFCLECFNINIIVIHHWCMLINHFLRELYIQSVKCWWDLNSVITFLCLKFDVLESLITEYNLWVDWCCLQVSARIFHCLCIWCNWYKSKSINGIFSYLLLVQILNMLLVD